MKTFSKLVRNRSCTINYNLENNKNTSERVNNKLKNDHLINFQQKRIANFDAQSSPNQQNMQLKKADYLNNRQNKSPQSFKEALLFEHLSNLPYIIDCKQNIRYQQAMKKKTLKIKQRHTANSNISSHKYINEDYLIKQIEEQSTGVKQEESLMPADTDELVISQFKQNPKTKRQITKEIKLKIIKQ